MAEYAQDLFSEEHMVSGAAGRRVIKTLTHVWAHLLLADAGGRHYRRVTVMEPPNGDRCCIEVHQPIQAGERHPRLATGERVCVISLEDGIRVGMRGHVEGVVPHSDHIAYTLVLEGRTYRRERRNAFRVPIELDDEVQAEIILTPDSSGIKCQVHDLSMTGAWLELVCDASELEEIKVVENLSCTVGLILPEGKGVTYSPAVAVWTARPDEEGFQMGVTWERPEPEFKRNLRRFVMNKERELIKRRSRA